MKYKKWGKIALKLMQVAADCSEVDDSNQDASVVSIYNHCIAIVKQVQGIAQRKRDEPDAINLNRFLDFYEKLIDYIDNQHILKVCDTLVAMLAILVPMATSIHDTEQHVSTMERQNIEQQISELMASGTDALVKSVNEKDEA